MIEILSLLFGICFAAGLNIYATVLALGLLQRFSFIQLPAPLDGVGSLAVLVVAGVMFVVEFFADKVPYVDSFWDAVHTIIRPVGAAVLAYSAVGDVSPQWQILAALAGGSVALTAHTAKASTRAAANLSPEPFSNIVLSLAEDGIAVFLVWVAVAHPIVALVAVALLIAIATWVIVKLSALIRRRRIRRAV